jgi:predicted transcriptional regulator
MKIFISSVQKELQVTPPVTPPVAVVVLIRLISSSGPLGDSEILANLGLRDRVHLRERYLDPALAGGLVERTIPEKPTSRLQKYRLTEKGHSLLEQLEKERDLP